MKIQNYSKAHCKYKSEYPNIEDITIGDIFDKHYQINNIND